MNGLKPYQPSAARPWNWAAAAHLLRRAGFAPRAAEVRDALRDGPAATMERLIGETGDTPEHDELDELGAKLAVRDNLDALRGWWLLRMCRTKRPLRARLAVFWHNHFATSNVKVKSAAMMLQQLRTFERQALGKFENLLLDVSRDPAMIVWLDGEQNVKGRPNENYARELFELFALGVGNYSEKDIREAARAFTGWHQNAGQYRFIRTAHDFGPKTVFGQTGDFDGADVVRLTLQRPACAKFMAAKLLREFLCPEPPAELLDMLAARLRETDFDLGATLKTLLNSEAMFDPRFYRARIKSPIEFAVGIVRSLEMQVPANALADAVSQMGQRLFEPPSVKGWDGHRGWLNSATMLVRLNAAARATDEGGFQPSKLRSRYDLNDSDALLRFCGELTLDGNVPGVLRERLEQLKGEADDVLRSALRLLLGSPEYQMA